MTNIQTVIKLLGELKIDCDSSDTLMSDEIREKLDTILIYAREADIPPMLEIPCKACCDNMGSHTCEEP